MKDKITNSKKTVKQTASDIKIASKNFERLVEAVSLLIVAGYAIYKNAPQNHALSVTSAVLLFAGAVIGTRGAVEFLKHLANK